MQFVRSRFQKKKKLLCLLRENISLRICPWGVTHVLDSMLNLFESTEKNLSHDRVVSPRHIVCIRFNCPWLRALLRRRKRSEPFYCGSTGLRLLFVVILIFSQSLYLSQGVTRIKSCTQHSHIDKNPSFGAFEFLSFWLVFPSVGWSLQQSGDIQGWVEPIDCRVGCGGRTVSNMQMGRAHRRVDPGFGGSCSMADPGFMVACVLQDRRPRVAWAPQNEENKEHPGWVIWFQLAGITQKITPISWLFSGIQ